MISHGQPFSTVQIAPEDQDAFSQIRSVGTDLVRQAVERLAVRWTCKLLPQCQTDQERLLLQGQVTALLALGDEIIKGVHVAAVPPDPYGISVK